MKVLLVSEPGENGVFRYVEALADFLLEHHVSVHLAYSDRRASAALHDLVARVEAAGGRTLNLRTSNRPAPEDLRALRALRAFVRQIRPDIIHSHSSKAGALSRALPLTGIRGPRHVYHPHAYVGMRPKRGRVDFVYDRIENALGRWSTSVACSHDERRYAVDRLRISPKRALCVPNGIDTARFIPVSPGRKRELREKFGLSADAHLVGTLGRCSAQKDPLTLYRAFARAAAHDPRLMLFHVGQGELDPELDALVAAEGLQGRIKRLPYLGTPWEFYQCIDAFALTSRYEGLSLALLEALSCDLPLILSDAPGNGDLLERPLSHLWSVLPGDVNGFARAISEWVADRCGGNARPSNHRAVAEEHYDQRRNFTRVHALYDELLKDSRVPHHAPAHRPA